MPKKTRKQKIAAQYRKKLKLLKSNQVPSPKISSNINIKETVDLKPKQNNMHQIILTDEDKVVEKIFRMDLKKSLFLIAGIITLEILFYFVSINNILRLGK